MGMLNKITAYGVAVIMSGISFTSCAKWHYGGGFGMSVNSTDLTISTQSGSTVLSENTLETDGGSELAKSLLQYNGYGTNGKWRFDYNLNYFEVSESEAIYNASAAEQAYTQLSGVLSFSRKVVEFSHDKRLYMTLGTRFVDYEVTSRLVDTRNTLSDSWVDAIVGFKFDMPLTYALVLHTSADVGGGSSEGQLNAEIGLNYKWASNWSVMLQAKHQNLEYEQSDSLGKLTVETENNSIGLQVIRIW